MDDGRNRCRRFARKRQKVNPSVGYGGLKIQGHHLPVTVESHL